MRLFVSAGEPSGDLHGANLIRAMRRREPAIEFDGFGGEGMAAAGCRLLYPLAEHAIVGFVRVLASVPEHLRLLRQAEKHLRSRRPDALVMIDYPGFHWWLARSAKKLGIPVVYFIPPQLWAWGQWRARKMRRLVDLALCPLPFEATFFNRRHVPARYVGHPYFDELRQQRLDADFMAEQQTRPGPVVALLPGSRNQELAYNLDPLLRAARTIHAHRPDVRFLAACLKPKHQEQVRAGATGLNLPLEVHAGRTPEIIELAHSCVAVSGSVGLELLYRGKPSVVTYRVNWSVMLLAAMFLKCEYISLVNLLAGKMLCPELLSSRCQGERMAEHVLRWLGDGVEYEKVCGELRALRDRVSEPGACERAAEAVLELVTGRTGSMHVPLAA
jgi:lipid-A-disaccharide synthase